MAIAVTCSTCETTERVADTLASSVVTCRQCGTRLAVPDSDGATAIQSPPVGHSRSTPRDEGDDDDDALRRSITKRPSSRGPILLILAGVGMLGCLGCGGLISGLVGMGAWHMLAPPQVVVVKDGLKDADLKDAFKDAFKDDPFKDIMFKDLVKDGLVMKGKPDFGPKDFIKGGNDIGGGKVILSQQGRLMPNDPIRDFKPHKAFQVRLEQGRSYVIDMTSGEMDSYLRLYDPAGFLVAQDDDGGGFPNARIRFTSPRTGTFTIAATCFGGVGNPNGAAFQLTVRQE